MSPPFLAEIVLAESQSHTWGLFHELISIPSRGLSTSKPQEEPNEGLHLCDPLHLPEPGRSVSSASCRLKPVPLAPLPQSQFPGDVWHLPGSESPPKTPTTNGSLASREAGTHPSPARAAQPPPAVRCSRTAGPVPAMPGSDRCRADPAHAGPARGWPCPLHARVTLRCLMGSGCLQEPLIPMRGENSNKRLKLSLSCLGKSPPRWECQNLWKIGAGQE